MDNHVGKIMFINRMDDFFNLLLKQWKAMLGPMHHENKLTINSLGDLWVFFNFYKWYKWPLFSLYKIPFLEKPCFERYVLLSVAGKATSHFWRHI